MGEKLRNRDLKRCHPRKKPRQKSKASPLKPSQPKETSERKVEIQEEKEQYAAVEDNSGSSVKTLPRNTPKKAGGKPIKR